MAIVNLEFDLDGNAFVVIPQDMIKRLGWVEGDELSITTKDGCIHVKKAKRKKVK